MIARIDIVDAGELQGLKVKWRVAARVWFEREP
jgi:hypothetical protein